MNKPLVLLVLAAAALSAACGGSGDSATETPIATGVPDSASASVAGMAAWINSASADSPDAVEPLDVTAFNPPVTDDIEPLGLAM
jgi:nitrous oxide reductase accessory protein NosL